jgi:ABC-type antimicrobial peptide transport system permease subunit
LMYGIREFFFRSAQLLISASMPWFSFVGATLITGAMMGLCVLYAYRSLSKVNVAAAIKE